MKTVRLASTFLLLGSAACGGESLSPPDQAPPPVTPNVLALSTYDASVGTLVEVYGEHFAVPVTANVELVFEGTFTGADGSSNPVSYVAPAKGVDPSTVRWTGFGPFANPFSSNGNVTGTFDGSVTVRITDSDGSVSEDPEPLPISFSVKPSVLVKGFQPLTASCNGNVLRGVGGAAYRVAVETMGFDPASITYTLSAPALQMPPVAVRHVVEGKYDTVGDRGNFVLPPVPDDLPGYGAILTVQARDADGNVYQNAFGFTVHRPLEVYYNGNVEVAEVYAPTPVSGCIPGGVNGRNTSYTESQAETRARNYAVSWNETWLSSHTVAAGSQETVGLSETNGIGFSTTDGESFRWSLGTEVGGTFGLDKLVSVGVKANAEVGGERSRSTNNSQNRTTGVNQSTTTTETESISQSAGQQQGEQFAWTVSSSEVISQSFGGHVIAGTFGVFYRQTLRLTRRAALVAYNQCGYATVVGDVDFVDWTWSPDLAMGNSCPPLPPSNLPSAVCYVPPCQGQ